MVKIMDANLSTTPGLGLPPPSNDQPAVVAQGVQAASASTEGLDQEWVAKAKAMIDRTKEDPYTESKELSKLKAGYLMARYNKRIEADE